MAGNGASNGVKLAGVEIQLSMALHNSGMASLPASGQAARLGPNLALSESRRTV
jgi:hypothetical protein